MKFFTLCAFLVTVLQGSCLFAEVYLKGIINTEKYELFVVLPPQKMMASANNQNAELPRIMPVVGESKFVVPEEIANESVNVIVVTVMAPGYLDAVQAFQAQHGDVAKMHDKKIQDQVIALAKKYFMGELYIDCNKELPNDIAIVLSIEKMNEELVWVAYDAAPVMTVEADETQAVA